MKNIIVQFAKWPRLGNVKTRLAKDLGAQKALDVHVALTQQVSKNVGSVSCSHAVISVDRIPAELTADDERFKNSLLVSAWEQQSAGNLGEKMDFAIRKHLTNYRNVLIVGSDCPSADRSYIEQAFEALDSVDVVIGPASDGGYVLIGMRVACSAVFAGVAWGGPDVLSGTIKNIQSEGLSYGLLETRWDVDSLVDYERWCRETGTIID